MAAVTKLRDVFELRGERIDRAGVERKAKQFQLTSKFPLMGGSFFFTPDQPSHRFDGMNTDKEKYFQNNTLQLN